MKNTKSEKKDKRLLSQMGVLIVVLFGIALVVCVVSDFFGQMSSNIEFFSEISSNLADYVVDKSEEYEALPWVLDYVEEEQGNMLEIFMVEEEYQELEIQIMTEMANIDEDTAKEYPDSVQHEFAQMVFFDIVSDTLKLQEIIPGVEITISRRTDDGDVFVFFKGDRALGATDIYALDEETLMKDSLKYVEYNHHGESYAHGNVYNYWFEGEKGKAPKLDYEWTYDFSGDSKRPFKLLVYKPIIVDGETVAVVTVERAWTRSEIADMMKTAILGEVNSAIYLIICGIALLVFVNYLTIKPLAFFQNAVRSYKEDKNTDNIVSNLAMIKSRNEIGRMSDDVSDMAVELDRYSHELVEITAEKERLVVELDVAAQIQNDILPKIYPGVPAFQDRDDFSIYASMTPAKEVGGDLFDFFLIDDDHLALVIGDVSGKGVPASLFMAITTTLIRHELQEKNMSVPDVLYTVNNCLCEGNEQMMFVTMWVAILELSTGKMVSSNAGHDFPMIRRGGGQFELIEEEGGIALGIMEGGEYSECRYRIRPGDCVYVYTDGVPEAINDKEEQFGLDRMLEALNENPDASPEELETRMQERLAEFVGDEEQFDDVTMLCVKLNW